MSKYIEELMSPQLMMVVYVFIAFVVALYLLSVAYVFIDAKRRGVQAFWAWGLLALIPFVGLIAYLSCVPACTPPIARSRSSRWLFASVSLPSTATAPIAVPPSRRTLSCAPSATRRFATYAPPARSRSRLIGKFARTAVLTSNRRVCAPCSAWGLLPRADPHPSSHSDGGCAFKWGS